MIRKVFPLFLILCLSFSTSPRRTEAGIPGIFFQGCGTLVQGVECILFQADDGPLFVLTNLGGFTIGDRVEVSGTVDPFCITFCQQGNGCLLNNTIEACPDSILGRCCFLGIVPDPVLCAETTQQECLNFAAPVSWTPGQDCNGDPCNVPPLGRCCFQGIVAYPVLCEVTTEEECFQFAAPVSWTEGEDCAGDPCNPPPLGRCCFLGIVPEPVLCAVTTEEECFFFAAPISWTEGENCDGDPCNAPETFAGCGVLGIGPQGCILLHTDSGENYAVQNTGGFLPGERVWVTGTINPDSFECFPVTIPAIENNTIGICYIGCGKLIQGVECVLFKAQGNQGTFVLDNLGGFQVGDRVRVTGCLNTNCFTICQQGDGCIEDNLIEPRNNGPCLSTSATSALAPVLGSVKSD